MVVGMEVLGATGGASKVRTWCGARDSAGLGGLVQARDGGEAIPPVVARIFSGDSTSPLTREARDSADVKETTKIPRRKLRGINCLFIA